jgi:hypothetical protein
MQLVAYVNAKIWAFVAIRLQIAAHGLPLEEHGIWHAAYKRKLPGAFANLPTASFSAKTKSVPAREKFEIATADHCT